MALLDALTVSDTGIDKGKTANQIAKAVAESGKQTWENMSLLDRIALAASPVPIAGDIAGAAADAYMYATKPEERNLGNILMSAAGLIPFIPAKSQVKATEDFGYRMAHQAKGPMDDNPIRLDDLTRDIHGEQAGMPEDFYSKDGQRLYAPPARFADDEYGISNTESYKAIQNARNNPDAEVTIYRGVPNEDSIDTINTGDFVTLSPKYAEIHASSGYGRSGDEPGKVLTQKVKVKDLFWDGNDVNEFGYFPETR